MNPQEADPCRETSTTLYESIIWTSLRKPGLELIKLEFILRLKIKCNDWLLAECVSMQPIIVLYFESENELKFYNLQA